MKDFTYIGNNEYDLVNPAWEWLIAMGLIETRWFLDAEWLMIYTTYCEWIDR